ALVDGSLVPVVNSENSVIRRNIRVPTRDTSIFTDKNEYARPRNPVTGDDESRSGIEDCAGRISPVSVARRPGDDDHERHGHAVRTIECRYAGAVIGHPEGVGRRGRKTPRVYQIGVDA